MIVDPRSKALVLNGKPGHLQFYSLQRDKLLYNVSTLLCIYCIRKSISKVCKYWPHFFLYLLALSLQSSLFSVSSTYFELFGLVFSSTHIHSWYFVSAPIYKKNTHYKSNTKTCYLLRVAKNKGIDVRGLSMQARRYVFTPSKEIWIYLTQATSKCSPVQGPVF